MTNSEGNRWIVLKLLPKKEQQVMARLEAEGYSFYFPTVKQFKICNNKKEPTQVPLFTGYIFVKVRSNEAETCLHFLPGTNGILSIGGQKAYATDAEIEVLDKACRLRTPPEVVNEVIVGEPITIKSGSLKGITGIVKQIMNKHYIYIEIGTTGMNLKLNLSESIVERALRR